MHRTSEELQAGLAYVLDSPVVDATELDLSQMMAKNVGLFGTSLRRRPDSEKATICREVEKHVWSWVGNGEVRPVVDRVMPMPEAGAAHTALDSGDVIGKIVLQTP